jgi:feruloyl esterase
VCLLISTLPLTSATANARASSYADLAVVKPVQPCMGLAKTVLGRVAGSRAIIQTSAIIETDKGQFCKVTGYVEPAIGFEVDLPVDHWTQRYLQLGCGGLCGMLAAHINNASGCMPALEGEFVVASDDMGHQAQVGSPAEAQFGTEPQKRIDFAYRGNHATAMVAKALITAYYGRSARYSYFMGCSDGGREALVEAQRFPNDFDGISAGDPAALFQVQNSFYHAWNVMADRRADGTNILMPLKRGLVHDAVVTQCQTLSGVSDGLLQDPRSCMFDPASLRCVPATADTAHCLTAEEVLVVQKLYDGASDEHGHHYTFGVQRGSELEWGLPSDSTAQSMSAGMAARSVKYLILPEVSPNDEDVAGFAFTDSNFERMSELAPLYDATNTNLKLFAAHGGRLILWHGWSDASVTPGISIAYYQAVQRYMGAATTDKFLRLFLLAGVGHCMGGDGYDQVDLLSPLMTWTELHQAPAKLVAGKSRAAPVGFPSSGPPHIVPGVRPIAASVPDSLMSRPAYPFPNIPRYIGQGDPRDANSYISVKSPVTASEQIDNEAMKLIGPDNQKSYAVKDNKLVVVATAPGT